MIGYCFWPFVYCYDKHFLVGLTLTRLKFNLGIGVAYLGIGVAVA